MRTENLSEVRAYYENRYKPILDAFESKKVKFYQINEDCGKYLELSVLMESGNKIFVNHCLSKSKPYNVTIIPAQSWFGKTTSRRFPSMNEAAACIIKEEYDW